MTLGSAYGLLGRIEQSRQSFLRALELDPNHVGSMDNLSFTYALAGQLDESLYGRGERGRCRRKGRTTSTTSPCRCSGCATMS